MKAGSIKLLRWIFDFGGKTPSPIVTRLSIENSLIEPTFMLPPCVWLSAPVCVNAVCEGTASAVRSEKRRLPAFFCDLCGGGFCG